jgi:hypothetical protein
MPTTCERREMGDGVGRLEIPATLDMLAGLVLGKPAQVKAFLLAG